LIMKIAKFDFRHNMKIKTWKIKMERINKILRCMSWSEKRERERKDIWIANLHFIPGSFVCMKICIY
jgi:hypothetical protein